jgi:hypothetical protein
VELSELGWIHVTCSWSPSAANVANVVLGSNGVVVMHQLDLFRRTPAIGLLAQFLYRR